ncbi:M14 family zinc carboxypeptidase [Glaciecola sp. KUL10]|uniref:M14 family zinc carboxypeptidase n=1 Tax=Glaciecola sp. (strain KUL10) TaxID=2161813 RepID=UPI000D787DD5|nr:M14 family zinc carboxypeptidase [Glaciecola sp. KUL10]GBL03916.1 hypothetical protein KUL10_12170 [Glaciecola sp. KUL10]
MSLSGLTQYIRYPELNQGHLKYADIADILDSFKSAKYISHKLAGSSFERRSIHLFTVGNGPISVFAWSQMHGDEATATASLIDLMSLVEEQSPLLPSGFESKVTFHILPMLNPDGAANSTRENAQSIDINRDALAQQSPEGQLLMSLVDKLKPNIALNLHDQCAYYQCGESGMPSTLAFLAPAFDTQKSENKSRLFAMQLIGKLIEKAEPHIEGKIAKYDDTHSARCFGDQIAGKGISTILIESGAHQRDPNRQIARALNTKCMIEVIKQCEHNPVLDVNDETSIERYKELPFNQARKICSLLIKNLNFCSNYQADVSIVQTRRHSADFVIESVGDLSVMAGLEELNANGYRYQSGTPFLLREELVLDNASYLSLLDEGYSHFVGDEFLLINNSDYDILINPRFFHSNRALLLNTPAYGLLEKEGKIDFALLNGKLVNLNKSKDPKHD